MDNWLERAETLAEIYEQKAALAGSPIHELAGDIAMRADTFQTITLSIPGDIPAEDLHQRLKKYAEFHGLEMTGQGLDFFFRHPDLDVPAFLRPASAQRVPLPALSVLDELDLQAAAS